MRRWLRILQLRWITRKWTAEDHSDCLSFMGPCQAPSPSCAEVNELRRLRNPPPKAIVR